VGIVILVFLMKQTPSDLGNGQVNESPGRIDRIG